MQGSFYYQEELAILRELAAEFARDYPAIAPMLAATGADSDVERILEGTAYLSSFVKERLDDEFPEIIQGLLQHVFPHYLRPIPSATLVAFRSPASALELRRGIELNSIPVDGVACRFTTTAARRILPLTIDNVVMNRHSEGLATLSIAFSSGVALNDLNFGDFPIFLSGAYADAVDAHRFVLDRIENVTLQSGSRSTPFVLPKDSLTPGGFADDEMLLPWPSNSFRGYRFIQEFFTLPEKFLFWRLSGFDKWRNRGNGTTFTLNLDLRNVPERTPEYSKDVLVMNVVPAVNIFPHNSEPIRIDHHRREYLIRPQDYTAEQCMVYSIRRVAPRNPADNTIRTYLPLERTLVGNPNVPVYAVYRRNADGGLGLNTAISVSWPGLKIPRGEVMSIDLLCTNIDIPSRLRVGDVKIATDSTPKSASFSNIIPPTAAIQPPLGQGTLWRLLSHFHANLVTLANRDALRKILGLYIFQNSRDKQRIQANIRRVEAIVNCQSAPANRLIKGVPVRGQAINLGVTRSNFASYGDMRLFGDVLEHFFSEYAAINCYTETTLHDIEGGNSWRGKLC